MHTLHPFNVTLGCFCVALLVAIVLAVRISALQAPEGAVVLGAPRVWRGHTACFRAAALDVDGNPVPPAGPVVFSLRDERGGRVEAAATGHPFAEVNLQVPNDLAVDAWIDVALSHSDDDREMVHVPILAVDAPGALRGHVSPWWTQLAPHLVPRVRQRPVQVALYPASGALVGGLSNRIVGRVSQQGMPWATAVAQPGLQVNTHSDALGLFTFSWLPPPQPQPLKFIVGTAPAQTVEIPVQAQARQLQLRVHPAATLHAGEAVEAHVDALPFRAPIMIDAWAGDVLLWGDTAMADHGQRDASMLAPAGFVGWLLISAARNPLAPQDTTSSALRWVGEAGQAVDALLALGSETKSRGPLMTSQATGAVAGQSPSDEEPLLHDLRTAAAEARTALLPLAMSRIVPELQAVPVLASTGEARAKAFATLQQASRASIYRFVWVVLAVGTGLAVVYVAQHMRRLRRAVQQVVADGLADGEEMEPELGRRVTRVEHRMYLGLTVASLLLAAYGIFTLIGRMRWR